MTRSRRALTAAFVVVWTDLFDMQKVSAVALCIVHIGDLFLPSKLSTMQPPAPISHGGGGQRNTDEYIDPDGGRDLQLTRSLIQIE